MTSFRYLKWVGPVCLWPIFRVEARSNFERHLPISALTLSLDSLFFVKWHNAVNVTFRLVSVAPSMAIIKSLVIFLILFSYTSEASIRSTRHLGASSSFSFLFLKEAMSICYCTNSSTKLHSRSQLPREARKIPFTRFSPKINLSGAAAIPEFITVSSALKHYRLSSTIVPSFLITLTFNLYSDTSLPKIKIVTIDSKIPIISARKSTTSYDYFCSILSSPKFLI